MDTALFFSGGKDSLACLHLYKEHWKSIYVVWINTGAPYQSTVEMMRGWKQRFPHFVEVNGNQPEWIEQHGYPVDVLPINLSRRVKDLRGSDDVVLQSYMDCCGANLWKPAEEVIRRLGIKTVIVGLRKQESIDNMVKGDVIENGVKYLFPIMGWTEADVFIYLKSQNVELPEGYLRGEKKSRECWNCTAWLNEDTQRIKNLPEPMRREVMVRLIAIKRATDRATKYLNEALDA